MSPTLSLCLLMYPGGTGLAIFPGCLFSCGFWWHELLYLNSTRGRHLCSLNLLEIQHLLAEGAEQIFPRGGSHSLDSRQVAQTLESSLWSDIPRLFSYTTWTFRNLFIWGKKLTRYTLFWRMALGQTAQDCVSWGLCYPNSQHMGLVWPSCHMSP